MTDKPEKKSKAPKEENKEDSKKPFVLKPKKPISPWIYFNNVKVAELKQEKGLDQKQAFAKSAEIWKGMDDEQKGPYLAKAKLDDDRYRRQLSELSENGFFVTEDGTKSTDLYVDAKKKYGEDCVVPKKPLSAYLYYTSQNVNAVKEKEGCSHPEAMKKCGEIWNGLDGEAKKKYQDLQEDDTARYKGQIEMLDKKGYFMMADGTKSSDHKAKKAKKRSKKAEEADTNGDEKAKKKGKKPKTEKTGDE